MIGRRLVQHFREAHFGILFLELMVLVVGLYLAFQLDRWNEERRESRETAQIIERLKSDTRKNLDMFGEFIPMMETNLANVRLVFRTLERGRLDEADRPAFDAGLVYMDVVPSFTVVFAAYNELIATGRLRELDDVELIELLAELKGEYDAAQAVAGYWRSGILGVSDRLDDRVAFYYTDENMNQDGMGVRYDFEELVADRNLRNKIFDAVDIHGDWLRLHTRMYVLVQQIDARLNAPGD